MNADLSSELFKQTVKEALIELLHEEPDAIRQVLAEALEDAALADAIREGQTTDLVERDAVLALLERRG